jgi:hypothetical protein
MRRLLGWAFHGLAAASLLLCVATAALWVRSYWVTDMFLAERREPPSGEADDVGVPHYGVFARSHGGQFGGWWGGSGHSPSDPNLPWSFELAHEATGSAAVPTEFELGALYIDYDGAGFNLRAWRLPGWALVAAAAFLPGAVVLRRVVAARRRRRARRGLCPACGYDLRATPDRCPECGSSTEKITEKMGHS